MKTLNTISKLKKGVALWTVLCGFITSASFAQTKEVDQELTQQITELVKNHFEILNTDNSQARLIQMKKTYTTDFHITDTHFENFGIIDFNRTIDQIHEQAPGAKFVLTADIILLKHAAKAVWKLSDTIAGEDIFLFRDGKIARILVFIKTNEE